jgi:antitoxin component HigA of HigAB toxin-antitoxin module
MTVHGIENDEQYRHALRTVSMLINLDPARLAG